MSETKQQKTAPAAQTEAAKAEGQEGEIHLTDRVLDYYGKAVERDSKWAYEHIGYALFHSLNDEQAMAELLKLGFKPKDALDHYNMGCKYAAEGKYAEAAKSFAQSVKLNPELKDAQFNHALALEMAGDLNGAKKGWKDIAELYGEEKEAEEIKQHLKELAGA